MSLHKNLIFAAQILCEPLPISSSTHVWIVDFFWTKFHPETARITTEYVMDLLFLPTFFVLLFFFRHHIQHLFKTLFRSTMPKSKSLFHKKWWLIILKLAGYLIAATITFASVFLGLKYLGTKISLSSSEEWIAPIIGLSITMLLQISLYFAPTTQTSESSLSLWKAIFIGGLQGFGAIPGVSRLGTTLVMGRWLNLPPHRSFEFSALLQVIIFMGNFIKNLLFSAKPDQFISFKPYIFIIKSMSWDTALVVIISSIISYNGLIFTQYLNSSKKLWKLAPYFLIPISIIGLCH